MSHKNIGELKFESLTKKHWDNFEALFRERRASGGCWCMWWRLKRSEFEKNKGKRNKEAMSNIVNSRERYPSLERSRVLKRFDDEAVWSIVCFFIDKRYRNKGVSVKLLSACIEYVKEKGGRVLEGYPIELKKKRMPYVFAWTGLTNTFKTAGFIECARRSETRPIMRYY